ncbi:MAG: phosphatase PAP2 family protein [Chitinophagaceae bacterium]|nr:phosphatase PAP2 family protein [Chitinophagaceae bacterium]
MLKRTGERIRKFWAALALLSAEMIVVLVVFFCGLIAFIFITREIFVLRNEDLDNQVFTFLQPFINDRNTAIMNFITFFGKHQFLIPANLFLIIYFLLIKKHKWYSIKIPTIAISSFGLMFGLKQLFARPRPINQLLEQAKGFSFPSGHALMSVTFYGLLAYIVWHSVKNKTLRWALIILLLLFILLIGVSRIYLRRHNYTDVIAGFAIGFLWLVISIWTINRMEEYSRKKINPVVQQPV